MNAINGSKVNWRHIRSMKKYRIDYMDADGEILTIKIEASSIEDRGDTIVFFDEHGEDGYIFYIKDIIGYCKL